MKPSIRIMLRKGERIFINGAVLRVDRKTSLELLNDVTFLLERQVMQVEMAVTPMRQLYFIVQMMLIDPADTRQAAELCGKQLEALRRCYTGAEMRTALRTIEDLIVVGRQFEALKTIRGLFKAEQVVREQVDVDMPTQAA
jgi:flagellar biosynthesis repressor protein FlbT